jgi:predicted nucleotidyltransferase
MTSKEKQIIRLIKSRISRKDSGAEVILFGSHARGDATSNSDWDILILLQNAMVDRNLEKEYREELFEVELETGEPISTLVFSKTDWENRHSATPLYRNIKREGILID